MSEHAAAHLVGLSYGPVPSKPTGSFILTAEIKIYLVISAAITTCLPSPTLAPKPKIPKIGVIYGLFIPTAKLRANLE
jgi:hypothetical protein